LRKDIRSRVKRSGFAGKILPKTVASKVFEETGRVYSVATYPSGRGRTSPLDLISLFDQGTTITAKGGGWLAIPTGDGPRRQGRGGMRYSSPQEAAKQGWKLVAIPARGGKMVLIAKVPGRKIVTHILIKMSTLRKRYDLQSAIDAWKEKMPKILAGEINKLGNKI
jgi:hypothetical protein